jgi:hypothetical protein
VGSRPVVRTLATCSCGCLDQILRARRDRVDSVGWRAVLRLGSSSTRGATRRETSILVWWVETWRRVRRRKLIFVRSLFLSVKPAISVCWRQGKAENAEWLGSRLVYVQFGRVFVVVFHASSV